MFEDGQRLFPLPAGEGQGEGERRGLLAGGKLFSIQPMNPLLKKEIRLVLPSFLAVLLLESVQPWFWTEPDNAFESAPFIFFFGIIILAVGSFGREFSLVTFQSLLSQPIDRRQLWRTKITVLIFATALILFAYFASCDLRLHSALMEADSVWHYNREIIGNDFNNSMFASGAAMLVALAGGLWTTLLLRQIAAAFWITFLVPAGLLMLIMFFMSQFFKSTSDTVVMVVLYGAAIVYSVSGFWMAHRLFQKAQDAAWTGGIISFSTWRYFESGSQSSVSTRHRKPVAALVRKEFQLQSISLFCAAALLVLHIAVIVMRKVHGSFERNSVGETVSEFYWAIWLVMPLIIGCTVVAEERRLGVMEEQFCLPTSRRLQFALKFLPTILFGTLLGGFMPLLLERTAAFFGVPNPDFHFTDEDFIPNIAIIGLALGLSLAGFFASTLSKNFLQALGASVVTIIGCCLFTSFARHLYFLYLFRPFTWNPVETIFIAILTALVTAPLLSYGNFKYFQERRRMCRRNVWGLTGAILFIFILSATIFNRAWEAFEPAEPAHGPALFSLTNPPVMRTEGYDENLLVQLPDGRVWFDYLNNRGNRLQEKPWNAWLRQTLNPLPKSAGPQRFLSGSNWVSAIVGHVDEGIATSGSQKYTQVLGYLDSVGIQSDGTLWISGKSDQNVWTADKLTRFGDETNWQQVSRLSLNWVVLLKKDGTLWRWGTNRLDWRDWPQDWPGLRAFQPYQIGTNTDWSELNRSLARKTDGSVWTVLANDRTRKHGLVRETNYDQIVTQRFSKTPYGNEGTYIRNDGTLWFYNERYVPISGQGNLHQFETLQCGRDTNWVSSAATWNFLVALKSDGTLWKWDNLNGYGRFSEHSIAPPPPTRLGIHDDWVAITGVEDGVVSLAADGSLWFWPEQNYYYKQPLMKLPKQPEFLGNIFAKPD
jgi:ABC-type transport system involved in multi-copper enzyme maturation permease subunit/alpha-tubulin suppressor-like RCC1 family protein